MTMATMHFFCSVHLVELRGTGMVFAMKAMDKSVMMNRNKVYTMSMDWNFHKSDESRTLTSMFSVASGGLTILLSTQVHRASAERQILELMDHPFLPTLYASFQVLILTHVYLNNLIVVMSSRLKETHYHYYGPSHNISTKQVAMFGMEGWSRCRQGIKCSMNCADHDTCVLDNRLLPWWRAFLGPRKTTYEILPRRDCSVLSSGFSCDVLITTCAEFRSLSAVSLSSCSKWWLF